MINLDEQISRCIIENRDRTGAIDQSDQRCMKDEILKCIADYISSIELPEKRIKAYTDNDEYRTALGYNRGVNACQAKLDGVVRELRR